MMNSYLALAIACPEYFTAKKPPQDSNGVDELGISKYVEPKLLPSDPAPTRPRTK